MFVLIAQAAPRQRRDHTQAAVAPGYEEAATVAPPAPTLAPAASSGVPPAPAASRSSAPPVPAPAHAVGTPAPETHIEAEQAGQGLAQGGPLQASSADKAGNNKE